MGQVRALKQMFQSTRWKLDPLLQPSLESHLTPLPLFSVGRGRISSARLKGNRHTPQLLMGEWKGHIIGEHVGEETLAVAAHSGRYVTQGGTACPTIPNPAPLHPLLQSKSSDLTDLPSNPNPP